MDEPNPIPRRKKLAKCFKEIPFVDDKKHVLVLSSLWNLAMNQPNDPEFPSFGIFKCMSNFILKGINHKDWLLKDQNIYIPYYAAHIIGSYAMNKPKFARKAANSGVIPPLLELLRGKMSWVEQRVAVRALGHLASHSQSFKELIDYEEEIVGLSMKMASNCLKVVYDNFVRKRATERLNYQCDLLTRGVGGLEFENRKAEEWASQLQCWSISLLDCFVKRERCIDLISSNQTNFLKDLSGMWGGLVNKKSPCGIGLIRSLCHTKSGRVSIASSKEVILSLCNTARSSDDWQYMAIESLLLVLKDPNTRYKVLDHAVFYLKDLVEISSIKGRKKVGEMATQVLLQDYGKIKCGQLRLSEEVERVLEEIWDVKVERKKREKLMGEEEIRERKYLATQMKKEGNKLFWGGNIEGGLLKYTKALDLCPLKYRKERIVLYSNRAQCYLLLKKPENVISDTTRALCLSSKGNKLHSKSLWRRSQAYDMIGLAKESLMDCLLFIQCNKISKSKGRKPFNKARLISKQICATWLFAAIDSNS
ncbi:Tetratricopeptide repeat protein 1 [Bienertia sinuspersici]